MSLEEDRMKIAKQIEESVKDSLLTATNKNGQIPLATGKLLSSIEVIPNAEGGFDILMEEYGEVIDGGRRKGAKQPPFTPQNVILDWINTRRIKPRDNNMTPKQLAFVISRGISRGSYTSRPFIERGVDAVSDKALDELFLSIENQIDKALG